MVELEDSFDGCLKKAGGPGEVFEVGYLDDHL